MIGSIQRGCVGWRKALGGRASFSSVVSSYKEEPGLFGLPVRTGRACELCRFLGDWRRERMWKVPFSLELGCFVEKALRTLSSGVSCGRVSWEFDAGF